MIRKHENSDSWKAGALAIGVHVALLAAMLISFNWKAAHPVATVTEVSLWDKLPAPKVEPKPEPTPIVEEKPEPKPVVEDKPKPEEPKVDIELEKKKREQDQKEAQEKIKKEHDELMQKEKELQQKQDQQRKKDALERLKQEAREDELKDIKAAEKSKNNALKKLQQEALSDEKGNDDKQASAANASLIGEYTEKIKAKIRGNVNKSLCDDGNPQLIFEISVLPTGQLSGTPKITKSSGNDTCDEAVEHAIIASEPLPLPDEASLKSQFKNLKLKFRPND
jgi:colicin import membrane protein